MSDKIIEFEKLLFKYKFLEPVLDTTKRDIYDGKRDSLVDVLKKCGEYSIIYSFILWLFYYSGKIGINLSLIWAKIVIATATVIVGATISTGTYYVVTEVIIDKEIDKKQEIQVNEQVANIPIEKTRDVEKNTKSVDSRKKDVIIKAPDTRLGVNRLTASGIDEKIASETSLKLYERLKALYGEDRIVYKSLKGSTKSVNRQLVGRISKLNEKIIISIRIVEGEKMKLLFNKTTIIKGEEIDDALDALVNSIRSSKNIWKNKH